MCRAFYPASTKKSYKKKAGLRPRLPIGNSFCLETEYRDIKERP